MSLLLSLRAEDDQSGSGDHAGSSDQWAGQEDGLTDLEFEEPGTMVGQVLFQVTSGDTGGWN
ncbi:MAG TPA: hypothetical protein VER39_16635 [Nocardioidaceae bacterium]|nr:hypothetical protein [Nocardioidaceae bacterium]